MTAACHPPDDWRPRCGACGSTSLAPRTARDGRSHHYVCSGCGRPWDGSEAPEPASEAPVELDVEQLADVLAGLCRGDEAPPPEDTETDDAFRARVLAALADPKQPNRTED